MHLPSERPHLRRRPATSQRRQRCSLIEPGRRLDRLLQIGKFQRAGETTWLARHNYDFAKVGIPGLSFLGMYESDSNIRTPTGDKSEWERNLTVSYVVQ
ncbi:MULTISPECIES: OprD family outer membrane porin [unclassified Pseudomonas]|uniref:OprD family outer membrane porin n=1 Tax=unclassified Pseudomonas TaxID=196821 RepID=UPI002B3C4121|nr:OprD family outer membrane porin [Pseudomonas sp. RTB3]MEB0150398.1 OprD family outer membrane porin [Pseudomonas sp. CCC2.2]MEB0270430.1 OprD family outer membrane porin [Pseudomonas sp. 5B4]